MDFSGRRGEAEATFKKAISLAMPNMLAFRLKGDWPTATPLFERAGYMFRQCGDARAAADCFQRAAAGHVAMKSPWHAAKAMERAAEMSRDGRDWVGVREFTVRAAEFYLEEGRPGSAADAAAKAGKALEEADPLAAAELYSQAISWLEDADKSPLAADTYRQAIAHLLRIRRWADAVAMMLRFAASCQVSGARSSQCKAYLGAVVTWLSAGDASQAWIVYQDSLAVDVFRSSDEAMAADALLEAYRAADASAIAATVSKYHCFNHLDGQVARMAKKLPTIGTDVAKMAGQLGGTGVLRGTADDEPEDDLT